MLKYLLALLLICQLSFAQTSKHIEVPGTKCSIIPPDGFALSDSFSGFYNKDSGVSIVVTEIPEAYSKLAVGFTSEALKARGMTLTGKQTLNHNGSEATFMTIKQSASGIMYNKQILMFSTSGNTVLVTGSYPEDLKNYDDTLRASLLSAEYNPAQTVNSAGAVNFTLNAEGTNLKLVKSLPGGLVYSSDNKLPTNSPTFIAGYSLTKIPSADKKQIAMGFLKELSSGGITVIRSTARITIDNLEGYEIIAEGKNSLGNKELVYQVVLFTDSGEYYLFVGNTAEDWEGNLKSFKAFSKTFKRK